MTALPATLASRIFATDRRESERVDVAIWARVRVQGQPEYPGWIKATALWSMGDRLGGEFEQMIEHDDLMKLRPYHL
jgi:hypothetical protein